MHNNKPNNRAIHLLPRKPEICSEKCKPPPNSVPRSVKILYSEKRPQKRCHIYVFGDESGDYW